MARFVVVLSLVLLFANSLVAQNSDPQALAYAAQSLAALTGGNSITDVTLTGSATWSLGSNQDQGPATLLAMGNGESRIDLQLSSGTRTGIRDISTGTPLGEWIVNGNPKQFGLLNCWTDAVWFFPAFSNMAVAPQFNVTLLYLGPTVLAGETVQHLQAYVYLSGQSQTTINFVQGVSTVDYYLDATSLLPVAMSFNTHPDTNANIPIQVQILFSNYQSVNGARVPFHVQKYFDGNLLLDINISSVVFNSGLPLSDLQIQ